jgi:type III pantothenate kinase
MTDTLPSFDPGAPSIVVDIGNTSVDVATWYENQLKTPLSVATGDEPAFAEVMKAHIEAMATNRIPAVVVASVVPKVLDQIRAYVDETMERRVLVVGEQVPLPIELGVRNPKEVGIDRVCAAAAAYETIQSGCIVIDFGTAVTVDLVDDEGVFRGGAILPGPTLQLRSLKQHTAALPEVKPALVDHAYGRDTVEAMRVGVCYGVAGAVRGLVERYAGAINHWPQVVATGGDLEWMAPACEFLDTCVNHLALRGIGIAYSKHLTAAGA